MRNIPSLLQCERYYGVAHLAFQLAVAAGADHDVLLSVPFVSHRRRLRARGEFNGPEFLAGIRVEGVEMRILRGCSEAQAAPGCNRSSQVDGAWPHARTHRAERGLPAQLARVQIKGHQ